MIKKVLLKLSCVVVALCIVLSLSGCSLYIASLDKLLRAPMSDPELEKTINKKLGSSVTFLAPSLKEDDDESDYLSSTLNYADLDSDGKDEVICFYSEKASPEIIHVLVLKSVNDKWNIVSDTTGSGSEITSLRVIQLSERRNKQVLTTWKYVDNQILNVSCLGDEESGSISLHPMCDDRRFDEIEMVDVNSDGYREILVVNYDPSSLNDDNVSLLTLLGMDESGSVVTLGRAEYPEECSQTQLNISKPSQETPFIVFLDYKDNNGVCHSGIYYWDVSALRLVNVFDGSTVYKTNSSGEKSVSTFNSSRLSPSKCVDINNDGTYDIPLSQSFSGGQDDENRLACTVWTKIVFSKDGSCLFSDADSEKRVYFDDLNYLKVPAYFDITKFYAFYSGNNEWSFIYGDFETAKQAKSSDGSCFARVEAIGEDLIEEYESAGYALLGSFGEEKGMDLVYKITDYGSAMGLKRDDIFNIK